MRDHSKASSGFWTGETGKALRGDQPAQVMAHYLFTCPASNMIGMYYLSLPQMCHETGLTKPAALKALARCRALNFAAWDPATEYTFVYEMAKWQIGPTCSPKDNRHRGVINLLEKLTKCPFYNDFLRRYRDDYALDLEEIERASEGAEEGLHSPIVGTPSPAPAPAPAPVFSSSEGKAKFVPPTVDEVREFCTTHGFSIDAQHFVDYYRQSGWKLKGGAAMKDWQATIRNWVRRDKENEKQNGNQLLPRRTQINQASAKAFRENPNV